MALSGAGPKVHYLPGENALLITRQHPIVLVPALFWGVVILVGGFWISFFLAGIGSTTVSGVAVPAISGTPIMALRLLVLVVGVGIPLKRWAVWRFSTFTLTDHRILVQHGVFSRTTESIPLDRIQNTVVHQSFIESMLHIGRLEIESASREGVEILTYIPEPANWDTALMEQTERYRTGMAGQAMQAGGAPGGPPGSNVNVRGRPMPWQDDGLS